jgi:hypothetical protein
MAKDGRKVGRAFDEMSSVKTASMNPHDVVVFSGRGFFSCFSCAAADSVVEVHDLTSKRVVSTASTERKDKLVSISPLTPRTMSSLDNVSS